MAKKKAKSKTRPNSTQSTNTNNVEKELPFVSICTPTFNRRPFIKTMFACFRNQDLSTLIIEWNGLLLMTAPTKLDDLIETSCQHSTNPDISQLDAINWRSVLNAITCIIIHVKGCYYCLYG